MAQVLVSIEQKSLDMFDMEDIEEKQMQQNMSSESKSDAESNKLEINKKTRNGNSGNKMGENIRKEEEDPSREIQAETEEQASKEKSEFKGGEDQIIELEHEMNVDDNQSQELEFAMNRFNARMARIRSKHIRRDTQFNENFFSVQQEEN
ncbi:hypothetical protein PIB30_044200 [Stylosanthes scabra]|uniref:Uncharacterized protein n=1 Tax=Stylosanthes scabra TaxID=79078 RepID=A0ABU6SFV4_9FABA|nr:hypothetical protein [Stylosanthes scabra]